MLENTKQQNSNKKYHCDKFYAQTPFGKITPWHNNWGEKNLNRNCGLVLLSMTPKTPFQDERHQNFATLIEILVGLMKRIVFINGKSLRKNGVIAAK